ncbi:patatin-like phospholipase family protein [Enterovibrio norvegicus]|uniref:patatin-like phospholipase family protein n=1 Tax=Enterovibrio norvegicus TaxID=188144 RepID=UPI0030628B71
MNLALEVPALLGNHLKLNAEIFMSTYKILSFCGGGERGLLSVRMLQRLQQENPGFLQSADMLTGCSTGAIISGYLALYKKYNGLVTEESVQDALQNLLTLYVEVMPKAFKHGNRTEAGKPVISGDDMEDFLIEFAKSINQDLTLKDLEDYKMSDLKGVFDLMIPAFNIRKTDQVQPGNHLGKVINQSWGMELFNNYDGSSTANVNLTEAVAASGAMPGLSESVNISAGSDSLVEGQFVDGAFVNHDPTMAAVSMAVSQGQKLEDISVVCFGTGFMKNYVYDKTDTEKWGSEQWLNLDDDNERYKHSNIPALFANEEHINPILNMCLNGTSTNEIPTQSSMLLGTRYAYLNPDLDKYYLGEDVYQPQDIQILLQYSDKVDLASANDVISKYWL